MISRILVETQCKELLFTIVDFWSIYTIYLQLSPEKDVLDQVAPNDFSQLDNGQKSLMKNLNHPLNSSEKWETATDSDYPRMSDYLHEVIKKRLKQFCTRQVN